MKFFFCAGFWTLPEPLGFAIGFLIKYKLLSSRMTFWPALTTIFLFGPEFEPVRFVFGPPPPPTDGNVMGVPPCSTAWLGLLATLLETLFEGSLGDGDVLVVDRSGFLLDSPLSDVLARNDGLIFCRIFAKNPPGWWTFIWSVSSFFDSSCSFRCFTLFDVCW